MCKSSRPRRPTTPTCKTRCRTARPSWASSRKRSRPTGPTAENEAYAEEQDKDIHYTGFPGKPGRYDVERTDEGVVVIDRHSGERQLAEEYKPGRYRFRADGKWRYITDKTIDAAAARRRTEHLPRALFNRRCNVEASVFQLVYHTRNKKLKYRGRSAVQLWAVCRVAWLNVKRIVLHQAKQAKQAEMTA